MLRRQVRQLLAVALATSLAACSYPTFGFDPQDAGAPTPTDASDDDALAESSVDADSEAATDALGDAGDPYAPSCPTGTDGWDLCSTIPHLPSGTIITLDGNGAELCDFPAFALDASDAQWTNPAPAPTFATGLVAHVRMAWFDGVTAATSGLVVHASILGADHVATTKGHDLSQGSAFELFVAGFSSFSGGYDSTTDAGALALLFPTPGSPDGHVVSVQHGEEVGYAPSSIKYASRAVLGGYEIEALIPWSAMANSVKSDPVPVAGSSIGVDMSVYARSSDNVHAEIIAVDSPPSPTPDCGTEAAPDCDDRAWCTARLGAP